MDASTDPGTGSGTPEAGSPHTVPTRQIQGISDEMPMRICGALCDLRQPC